MWLQTDFWEHPQSISESYNYQELWNGLRCIRARFQWGMHYVHTSSTHSTQVCLALIRCIQGLLEKHIFSTWYLKLSVLCNENCLSTWMLISRRPDSRHALAWAEERRRGCGQLLSGVKLSTKAAFIHGGRYMGAWPLEIKTQYVRDYPKEMPSQASCSWTGAHSCSPYCSSVGSLQHDVTQKKAWQSNHKQHEFSVTQTRVKYQR